MKRRNAPKHAPTLLIIVRLAPNLRQQVSALKQDMQYLPGQSINDHQRVGVGCAAGVSIIYSLIVIWYVATFPDVGIRALFPMTDHERQLLITQFIYPTDECDAMPVLPGQRLSQLRRNPAGNFLSFTHALAELRSAPISADGVKKAGTDPSELPMEDTDGLVEIPGSRADVKPVRRRMVELHLQQPDGLKFKSWVPVKSMPARSFLPTIFWFLCQLGILVVALTAWWQRPADRVIRIFCLMCCVSMPAFVGGFHWWILVASPLLNLPFIFAACLLPAVTLHFFCRFPRENFVLQGRKYLLPCLVYLPAFSFATVIAVTYWTAFALNGASADQGQYTILQKLVAVTGGLAENGVLFFNGEVVVAELLFWLRILVYAAITLSSLFFGLTVVSLFVSLVTTQNPVERKQASGILVASLISTVPILYTVYLAFFRKTEFALGHGQIPMFIASGLFMAAYAHGMLKHRLILAEEVFFRRRQYLLTSGVVTSCCAVALALGAVATRVGLPDDSSLTLQLSLFVVLVVAAGFVLWARDRIQSVVDQRFFSEKYQVDKTLKQLNKASGYLTDPSALAEITLVTCRDVMDASSAAMYVREASGRMRLIGADKTSTVPTSLADGSLVGAEDLATVIHRPVVFKTEIQSPILKLMQDLAVDLVCFLRSDTGIDGLLMLGPRLKGAGYSAEDIAFLQAIGQMTGLALHSSRANQNLARLSSELEAKVDRIAEQQHQLSLMRAELQSLQDMAGEDAVDEAMAGFDRGEIRGKSAAIREILETVRKVASSPSTVLVRGESGTGKELLAHVIHRNSERADKPIVSVNCAALAPSLLESELFGHVRGAFTGANSDKAGRFQAANGGTLFLDEIGDISPETQVKLLRVLQERRFEPVGSNESIEADVRLVAATHRNLESMIASGEFREDLYYRLNVVSVTLPALRERREDLIELVFFFLNAAVKKTSKKIRQIEPTALAAIEQHRWPGNVRELENAIERAVVLADGNTIKLKDLPDAVRKSAVAVVADSTQPLVSEWPAYDDLTSTKPQELSDVIVADDAAEARQIADALRAARGNKAKAARSLNMPRSTFYSKLKKLDLA